MVSRRSLLLPPHSLPGAQKLVSPNSDSTAVSYKGFQEWRYRRLKMTERTIGNKPGTGDSAGVACLATTLKATFPDLWEMRSAL